MATGGGTEVGMGRAMAGARDAEAGSSIGGGIEIVPLVSGGWWIRDTIDATGSTAVVGTASRGGNGGGFTGALVVAPDAMGRGGGVTALLEGCGSGSGSSSGTVSIRSPRLGTWAYAPGSLLRGKSGERGPVGLGTVATTAGTGLEPATGEAVADDGIFKPAIPTKVLVLGGRTALAAEDAAGAGFGGPEGGVTGAEVDEPDNAPVAAARSRALRRMVLPERGTELGSTGGALVRVVPMATGEPCAGVTVGSGSLYGVGSGEAA